MTAPKRMTDEQRATVFRLHAAGWTRKAIAEHIGFTPESVRRLTDPEWAALRRKAINENRNNVRRNDPTHGPTVYRSQRRYTHEELRQRIEEIPDDTRDLTGRLMGDPLPGRSALDRSQSA